MILRNGLHKKYQGVALAHFSDNIVSRCSQKAKEDFNNLEENIKERLSWSDLKLLRSIAFTDTRCWASSNS